VRGRGRSVALGVPSMGGGPALTIGIAAALAAVAFGADGGLRIAETTWTEIALTLLGGALAAAALVFSPANARGWGLGTLAAFAGLAAFTALSVVWAIQPAGAWLEASRTFAYLAAFAGAIAMVRLVPHRWEALLGGVAVAALAVCAYALLTKVFPASLNADETYARLREPFGYWNAVALMAALGVPPLLWLGARRESSRRLAALAYPGLGLLIVTMLLSYSRGALLALALGLVFWFAVVPLRLRGLAVLVPTAVVAAPVVAFAFGSDGLSEDRVSLALRTSDGHTFGILLVVMVAVLVGVGLGVNALAIRRPPSAQTRRRVGIAAIVVAALIPVAAVVGIAASSSGLGGTWRDLTDPNASLPKNDAGRLTAAASARARYYDEAFHVFGDHKLIGSGADGYATGRERYAQLNANVRHAHGYVPQTLADLGLAGLAVSLLLFGAWLWAAIRATALRPRDRGSPFTPERVGLLTLFAVVIVFGVHSFIDWTWFVPGTAVTALLCAGWLAGRGTLDTGPVDAPTEAFDAPIESASPRRRVRALAGAAWARLRAVRPERSVAALGVLAFAAVAAFAIWQPLRSVQAGNDALLELSQGRSDTARSTALTARKRNPLSVEPLFDLAVIEDSAGNRPAARRALERAVALQPANPETWRRLGNFRLNALGDPQGARNALRAALYLDPNSIQATSDYILAGRAIVGQQAPTAP